MKYIPAEKLIAEIERRIEECNIQSLRGAELSDLLSFIDSLQQEQPVTKEQSSYLEYWLAFFGCPEENIEECATQIAQGYGAIRYLQGIQHGAEAVNELAQQEQPEVDFEKAYKSYIKSRKDDLSGNAVTVNVKDLARHFYELGRTRKE